MTVNPTLYCPIRGQLKIRAKTQDGLTFTEEKRRIDGIKYLLDRNYPTSHIKVESTIVRFGNAGRNSFRTDIVVFKEPARRIQRLSLEDQREMIYLIGEIKRDNKDADVAKKTQVRAAMGFLPDLHSVGLYWDDIEQKIFYKELRGTKQRILEAPLAYLPSYGSSVNLKELRYSNLQTSPSLVGLFSNIENTLHSYIADISIRYELLLQLLLVKIFDESRNRNNPDGAMLIQDFTIFDDIQDNQIVDRFDETLNKSLNIYQRYLPKSVSNRFQIDGSALREISKAHSAREDARV